MVKNITVGGRFEIGPGQPLAIFGGPCTLESPEICHEIVTHMKEVCARLGVNYVFKASFDKANRTSIHSQRGPGLTEGLRRLKEIKEKYDVPIITDIHEPSQAEALAEVVDIIQIPAFLCRQTDLLVAVAKTGKTINVKKGQFLAPKDMKSVINKLEESGNSNLLLCERGYTFGYNNLIVDMRALDIMRHLGYPVVFDATHSVQLPGGQGTTSGGERQFVSTLARAAAGVGTDAFFMEIHPNPEVAISDGANSLYLKDVEDIIKKLVAIDAITR